MVTNFYVDQDVLEDSSKKLLKQVEDLQDVSGNHHSMSKQRNFVAWGYLQLEDSISQVKNVCKGRAVMDLAIVPWVPLNPPPPPLAG